MWRHRFTVLSAVLSLPLAGCDYLETATADRPNSQQRTAIVDILAHFGSIAAFLGDPSGADDGDLADLFHHQPYFQLLDPDQEVAVPVPQATRLPVLAEGCIEVDGESGTALFNCNLYHPDYALSCNANGAGAETAAGHYTGAASLCCPPPAEPPGQPGDPAPTCGGFGVALAAVDFTFVDGAADGSLTVAGLGTADFGFAVTLDGIEPCSLDDPTPNGGEIRVEGTGGIASGLGAITIRFTGVECGVAIID